jgi:hypothetical protein
MKKCKKCNIEKQLNNFYKEKRNNDGFSGTCKICIKKYNKEYKTNNIDKVIISQKKWVLNNLEKIKEYKKEYFIINKEKISKLHKEYHFKNKDKLNKIYVERKNNNPLLKLKCNTRNLIGISIKRQGYSKKSKTFNILGCSFDEFKAHLEKQFTEGMNWENQGQWHMDHIYPVSLAKNEEELIKLNHYTNFQPLWAIDNLKKGNKI